MLQAPAASISVYKCIDDFVAAGANGSGMMSELPAHHVTVRCCFTCLPAWKILLCSHARGPVADQVLHMSKLSLSGNLEHVLNLVISFPCLAYAIPGFLRYGRCLYLLPAPSASAKTALLGPYAHAASPCVPITLISSRSISSAQHVLV